MPITPKKIRAFTINNIGFSEESYEALLELSRAHNDAIWNHTDTTLGISLDEQSSISTFKANLKEYLYSHAQDTYCCYCGNYLEDNKGTYSLEHIICKNNKSNVVFHLKNLALACYPCNSIKSIKKVTHPHINEDEDKVFDLNTDYVIVHPHLDDWDLHLFIDRFQRVLPLNGSLKGQSTIEICGISRKNAARLASHFDVLRISPEFRDDFIDFYTMLESKDDSLRKTKFKKLLKQFLSLESDPAGSELISLLGLNENPAE